MLFTLHWQKMLVYDIITFFFFSCADEDISHHHSHASRQGLLRCAMLWRDAAVAAYYTAIALLPCFAGLAERRRHCYDMPCRHYY